MDVRCIHNGYKDSCQKCLRKIYKNKHRVDGKLRNRKKNYLVLYFELDADIDTGEKILQEAGKLILKRYQKRREYL
jgi:hypothetical protein